MARFSITSTISTNRVFKAILIIFLSLIIGSRFTSNNYLNFSSALIVLPILMLLILQPDIGQTLLISSVWLSLIFVSGINLYFLNFLIFSLYQY